MLNQTSGAQFANSKQNKAFACNFTRDECMTAILISFM